MDKPAIISSVGSDDKSMQAGLSSGGGIMVHNVCDSSDGVSFVYQLGLCRMAIWHARFLCYGQTWYNRHVNVSGCGSVRVGSSRVHALISWWN